MRNRTLTLVACLTVLTALSAAPALAAPGCCPSSETAVAAPVPAGSPEAAGWKDLLNGKDTDGWTGKPTGGWKVVDGALTWQKGCGYLWTKEKFGNFILLLDFKLVKGCNSGVFIRTGNTRNPVQTGMEIQVLDSFGKKKVGKHDCGALYDAKAPMKNAIKKPGEWNTMMIMCAGPKLGVVLNGEMILDADLDEWDTARKNPDKTKNKYKVPLKDFPRAGHIGVQDHGKSVSYRNVKILPMKTCAGCEKSGGFCKKCQQANGPAVGKALRAELKPMIRD